MKLFNGILIISWYYKKSKSYSVVRKGEWMNKEEKKRM